MNNRDPHSALKTEVVASSQPQGLELKLVRLQWGKDDIGYSLHAAPNSYTMAGFQLTDLLSYLGFHRSHCHFVTARECYVRWAEAEFSLEKFGPRLADAFIQLKQAAQHFERCGFFLPQPEGWGYFQGRPSGMRPRPFSTSEGGDGHTASVTKCLKTSEDATFSFLLSWLEGNAKGWTFHYRPKHPPLSTEIQAALRFLELRQLDTCPEFDFEPCHWRFVPFESRNNSPWDSNAHYVHGHFDAHATSFSQGLELLLGGQAAVEPFGMRFLPLPQSPEQRAASDIERRVLAPRGRAPSPKKSLRFDVAISFAGTERSIAEHLAKVLQEAGFAVFYDAFYPEELWGKDLVVFFDEIYRKSARFCVILVSQEYVDRQWTNHERRSAQARALQERGGEYILPIKVDNSELPGMPPTIGYVSLSDLGIDWIATLLVKKLQIS